jgi:hypothetical protein
VASGFRLSRSAICPPAPRSRVDYRHLLAPGQQEEFLDSTSGEPIVGHAWHETMARSTAQLQICFSARVMMQFLVKVLVSALVIAGASELARRYSVIGALLAACR